MSENNKTLKKFGIISTIIFSVIIILSMLWIHLANNELATASSINIIILSAGIIGFSYCIMIVRKFDNKIDKDIVKNYDKIIKEYSKNGD